MVEPPVPCTCASKRIAGVPEAFRAEVLSAIAPLPGTDRDLHGNQASCGPASGASRFLTGLVTCSAAHGGIPAEPWPRENPLINDLSGFRGHGKHPPRSTCYLGRCRDAAIVKIHLTARLAPGTPVPPAPDRTAWMPRSCTYNDMNEASTSYEPATGRHHQPRHHSRSTPAPAATAGPVSPGWPAAWAPSGVAAGAVELAAETYSGHHGRCDRVGAHGGCGGAG